MPLHRNGNWNYQEYKFLMSTGFVECLPSNVCVLLKGKENKQKLCSIDE